MTLSVMMTEARFFCDHCGGIDYKVLESRKPKSSDWVRRRIACRSCGHRVTTYEVSEQQFAIFQAALARDLTVLQTASKLHSIAAELESL
jgi:transcriptional regulator NrdR family protein